MSVESFDILTTEVGLTDYDNASYVTEEYLLNGSYYEYEYLYDDYDEHNIASSPLFEFVVHGVLLTLVGLLGIAGNMISIVILYRLKVRSSINCCLLGLTTFDLLLLITSVTTFGLLEIGKYVNSILCGCNGLIGAMTTVLPLGYTARTGSIYLTVILTVERYVAVCLPFRFRSLVTYGRARIMVIVASVFSVVYNLPRFLEHFCVEHQVNGGRAIEIKSTKLRQNGLYQHIYITWMYLLVQYVIPFLGLLILNCQIYLEVRSANQGMERLSRPRRKEIKMAVMLLAVVIVFFLCNTLACVLNILEIGNVVYHKWREISNLLITINSSVNFIIYCTFSQRFRKDFLKMFHYCCMRKRRRLARNSSTGYDVSRNVRNTETVMLSVRSDPRKSRLLNSKEENNETLQSLNGTSISG